MEEFHSINERMAAIEIELHRRYTLKVVQVYAPTSSQEDEEVESFYEDLESAMGKVKTQYTVLMGDFNSKVSKKHVGDHAVGDYGIGTRKGNPLIEFAERNNLTFNNVTTIRSFANEITESGHERARVARLKMK